MTLTLTLTYSHDAFDSFYAPVFCDFVRNYSPATCGRIVTSYSELLVRIHHNHRCVWFFQGSGQSFLRLLGTGTWTSQDQVSVYICIHFVFCLPLMTNCMWFFPYILAHASRLRVQISSVFNFKFLYVSIILCLFPLRSRKFSNFLPSNLREM